MNPPSITMLGFICGFKYGSSVSFMILGIPMLSAYMCRIVKLTSCVA